MNNTEFFLNSCRSTCKTSSYEAILQDHNAQIKNLRIYCQTFIKIADNKRNMMIFMKSWASLLLNANSYHQLL